jgi:hypothetical protein
MTDFARVVRKIPIQNSYYGKSVHLGRDVFGSVLRVSVTVRDEIYTGRKQDESRCPTKEALRFYSLH